MRRQAEQPAPVAAGRQRGHRPPDVDRRLLEAIQREFERRRGADVGGREGAHVGPADRQPEAYRDQVIERRAGVVHQRFEIGGADRLARPVIARRGWRGTVPDEIAHGAGFQRVGKGEHGGDIDQVVAPGVESRDRSGGQQDGVRLAGAGQPEIGIQQSSWRIGHRHHVSGWGSPARRTRLPLGECGVEWHNPLRSLVYSMSWA